MEFALNFGVFECYVSFFYGKVATALAIFNSSWI